MRPGAALGPGATGGFSAGHTPAHATGRLLGVHNFPARNGAG